MIQLDARLQLALDSIPHVGCPVCGDSPTSIAVDGPEWIALNPCGHSVPMDAVLEA